METTNSPFKQSSSEFTVAKDVLDVQVGDYALLRDFPCKITQITRSKPGKVGIRKALLQGVDILTGKKYEDIVRESSQIQMPIFTVSQYQLIGVSDDGYVTLLDDNCEVKEDIKLPYDNEKLTQKIKSSYASDMDMYVEVTSTMGKQVISSMKNAL